MTEKKQFYKEEVTAYSELFQQLAVKKVGRLGGKEGVPLEVAAKLLEEKTLVPWSDQVLLLLKSYGSQLPSRFVLSGVTSASDITRHQVRVKQELATGLEISLSKTNFMYLCQNVAIYQSDEMKGVAFTANVDIKTFKKKFRKVPLADFTSEAEPPAELTMSMQQPQALSNTRYEPVDEADEEQKKVVIDVRLSQEHIMDGGREEKKFAPILAPPAEEEGKLTDSNDLFASAVDDRSQLPMSILSGSDEKKEEVVPGRMRIDSHTESLLNQTFSNSFAEDADFHVSIPQVNQILDEPPVQNAPAAAQEGSSWFGGYVSLPTLPAALTGGSAQKMFTAYHIITVFEKNSGHPQTFEVDRRFSQFEKLLAYLRQLPGHQVIPELPKKRFFNSSEQVIETRRTELENFLRTLLRNQDLRANAAVRYFLCEQDGVDNFLGNVGLYSWAYTSLASIDTKNLSFDMLKAVAQSEMETRGSSEAAPEPRQFQIAIPNADSQQAFLDDLDDRLKTLEAMRDVFSAQAKLVDREAQQINQIGLALQALSSIDFNDTFQVVLKKPSQGGKPDINNLGSSSDGESSGDATGSTGYEMIQSASENKGQDQAATDSKGDGHKVEHLKLLKSESGNTNNRNVMTVQKSSVRDLYKGFSQEYFSQMKQCELRAKGLLSALHSELKGLSRAFQDRHRLIQSYKVTEIVIGLKHGKLPQVQNPAQLLQAQNEISYLEESLQKKEADIFKLNERLLAEIASYYERQWTETLQQVTQGFAVHKTQYFARIRQDLASSCVDKN